LSRSRADKGWSWSIMTAALVLLIMAVVDFVNPGSGETVDLRPVAAATERLGRGAAAPTELHHLLPDASADLGRAVQVAGTIIGQVSDAGFWIRDLRDNVVFVGADEGAAAGVHPRTGGAVRVRGVVALFPPAEPDERLRAAALAPPAGATVVREVKVRALAGGITILEE
jgi:hypothetical protein